MEKEKIDFMEKAVKNGFISGYRVIEKRHRPEHNGSCIIAIEVIAPIKPFAFKKQNPKQG
jgi:regulator of RNase E activity RraB